MAISPTVARILERKPSFFRFNPLYLGLVVAAALLLLFGAGPLLEDAHGVWAYVPGFFSLPFGVVLSSEVIKQGERRNWPPLACALMVLFCTLVFAPLYTVSLAVIVGTLIWGLPVVAMVTMLFWFVWLVAAGIWGDEPSVNQAIVNRNLDRLFHSGKNGRRMHTLPSFRFHLVHLLLAVVASALTGWVLTSGRYIHAFHGLVPNSVRESTFDTGWQMSNDVFATNPVVLAVLLFLLVAGGVVLAGEITRVGRRRGWSFESCTALVALTDFLVMPAILTGVFILLENISAGFCAIGAVVVACWLGWSVVTCVLGADPEYSVRRLRTVRVVHSPSVCRRPSPAGEASKQTPRRYQPKWVPSQSPHCSVGMKRMNM